MARELRYVDPNRTRGWFSRAFASFSATRLGKFLSRTIVWRLDPILLRVTGGRIGMGATLPTALLETTGAKSGQPRRNAVIYFHDGERVTVIASRAGDTRHPAWFHNLRGNPDVIFGGIPMRATVVADDAERQRIWALADRVFPPFAAYRRDAAKVGREIPIVQLTERT
jgi:deazaflavin-dependent oxidoreductase (nitroreductase family)